jgi:hypothetical protein
MTGKIHAINFLILSYFISCLSSKQEVKSNTSSFKDSLTLVSKKRLNLN